MRSTFAFLAVIAAIAQADDSALVAQLVTANSQVTRITDVLSGNGSFLFDFLANQGGPGQGGFAVNANSVTFPAILTGGTAMTVGVLGPCGANPPHTHPRGTEMQILTQGGPLHTEFIMENGSPPVKNNLTVGQATMFPKGSMHFQQNLGCEPAVFVAAFDFPDPGTLSIAQSLLGLNRETVDASFGAVSVSFFDNLTLPPPFILGARSCLAACNISSSFNFSATYKDFAAFSNSSWGLPSSSSAAKSKTAASFLENDKSDVSIPFSKNPLRMAVIGLGAAAGALLLVVIGLLVTMVLRRRSGVKIAPRFPGGAAAPGQTYAYGTPYDETESLRRSTDKQ